MGFRAVQSYILIFNLSNLFTDTQLAVRAPKLLLVQTCIQHFVIHSLRSLYLPPFFFLPFHSPLPMGLGQLETLVDGDLGVSPSKKVIDI